MDHAVSACSDGFRGSAVRLQGVQGWIQVLFLDRPHAGVPMEGPGFLSRMGLDDLHLVREDGGAVLRKPGSGHVDDLLVGDEAQEVAISSFSFALCCHASVVQGAEGGV